jgi:Cu+-exporting ATPase
VINDDGKEDQIPVSRLKKGQRIRIHSHEIIPADAILFLGKASVDYSFVTGESLPVDKSIGEIVYAGGKQCGGAIELEVIKEVSQSYLTQLWNNDTFKKEDEKEASFIHGVSRYFTLALFSVAAAAAIYWYINDTSRILNAVTAVLIVACPCALLLSATFTNGNMLSVLQRFGFYAKNALVLERIKKANTIVFDKTGTLTVQKEAKVVYHGLPMDPYVSKLVRMLAHQSSHPLSRAVVSFLPFNGTLPLKKFSEEKGKGLSAMVDGQKVMLGSAAYILGPRSFQENGSKVYVCINNEVLGYFSIQTAYRKGLGSLIADLKDKYRLALISGDNRSEEPFLRSVFGPASDLRFEQKPLDKLEYIQHLKQRGEKVIMVGDGLNDAGALKISDVGIAITDNINNFSPACDVILSGESFPILDKLLAYCAKGKPIILWSFLISVLYNIIGLYFAFFGFLQPVIAAILMPVSSISIILFTTGMSSLFSLSLYKSKKRVNAVKITCI